MPVQGAEREYFYFPQNYDFLHLSVGDWRSTDFLRELIERLAPDVVHFHHYHRVGVESFRAARLAAPNAVICLTFHEMMAICMADGQMVKKNSRELCHAASPIACNKCFPDLRAEFVTLRAARLKAALDGMRSLYLPLGVHCRTLCGMGAGTGKMRGDPQRADQSRRRFRPHAALARRSTVSDFSASSSTTRVSMSSSMRLLILGQEQRIPECGVVIEINGGNKHYASKAYFEKIMRQVEDLRKIQNGRIEVRERGPYSRDELAERMRAVDWVLVPSTWWEIFGLVVSEAWMFGRPVIASAIAGLKERVQPGVNGFTFPARDARALADLIVSLAGNEQQWLKVNRTIEQPWTEFEMLEAHESAWREARPPVPRGRDRAPVGAELVMESIDAAAEPRRNRNARSRNGRMPRCKATPFVQRPVRNLAASVALAIRRRGPELINNFLVYGPTPLKQRCLTPDPANLTAFGSGSTGSGALHALIYDCVTPRSNANPSTELSTAVMD